MTGRGGRRLAVAMLVSVAVGAASDEQILALRDGLRSHPVRVLGAVVLAAAALVLPVLVVFHLVYGPLTGSREPRE
jgi:hypothetical protein